LKMLLTELTDWSCVQHQYPNLDQAYMLMCCIEIAA
jgi:hypothetical protein